MDMTSAAGAGLSAQYVQAGQRGGLQAVKQQAAQDQAVLAIVTQATQQAQQQQAATLEAAKGQALDISA